MVQDQYEDAVDERGDFTLRKITIMAVNRACRPASPIIKVIQGLPQQQKYVYYIIFEYNKKIKVFFRYLLCGLAMLTLNGKTKPTITQIINACAQIPFAKALKKPDILRMISQLRETGLVSSKTYALSVDEEDVCFAFEDSPLAKFLTPSN